MGLPHTEAISIIFSVKHELCLRICMEDVWYSLRIREKKKNEWNLHWWWLTNQIFVNWKFIPCYRYNWLATEYTEFMKKLQKNIFMSTRNDLQWEYIFICVHAKRIYKRYVVHTMFLPCQKVNRWKIKNHQSSSKIMFL